MNYKDKHFKDIIQMYPNAVDFRKPAVEGMIHDVYIVKNDDGQKFVCRFSSKKVALHNQFISKLLLLYNINVPDISVHKCFNDEYCETYPFIQGKTLQERLIDGIKEQQQDKIFHQLFDINYKISQISCHNIINLDIPITSKIPVSVCKKINKSPVLLCHTDLLTKNVILDNDDNVAALIDLDDIRYETIAFALINLIQDAKRFGYDVKKLKPLYAKYNIHPKFISIENQAELYMIVKNVGKFIFNESLRKQLLKIKEKSNMM